MREKIGPAIEVRGLVRTFLLGLRRRRHVALGGIDDGGLDLSVERGATLGLVGPNGSGKSTLVRILAGVDRPTRGEVRILGHDPRSRAARSQSAYLPEDSPFPGELSAPRALDLLGSLAGISRADSRRRGGELLERVGLGGRDRLPLRAYSRGMLRRFGLAQAFLARPSVVWLDEPTAGLDAPGFGVLDELLTEARGSGATVVLASHLVSDVHSHCDRLAVLVGGRLAAHGTPSELLDADGRVRLELEGLGDTGLADLETWIEERGAKIVSRGPGGRELSELYGRLASEERA